MKAHVQNPWTNKPSLMVNMSVEEVQQLDTALRVIRDAIAQHADEDGVYGLLKPNEYAAFSELERTIEHALSTDRPNGIKGALP